MVGFSLNGLQGHVQLLHSVLGFLIGIAVFFIPFAFGWMGGGDVKYFGLIGALLGVQWIPRVLFYSILLAGIMAIGCAVVGRFSFNVFKETLLDCKLAFLSLGRVMPEPIDAKVSKGAHSIPWGVALGAGTLLAYYFDPSGQWAGF